MEEMKCRTYIKVKGKTSIRNWNIFRWTAVGQNRRILSTLLRLKPRIAHVYLNNADFTLYNQTKNLLSFLILIYLVIYFI